MAKNMTGMKKIISVMLLGSLLVSGAVVYADTLSDTGNDTNRGSRQMMQRGLQNGGMLSQLVTDGIITAEEQATIEKAMLAQREAMKADKAAMTPPAAGTERVSHFDQLADDGVISQELADKIDAYMTAQRDAAFATEMKPLVDGGTFADTAAVQTAMDVVREAMSAQMADLKSSVEREKVDFKSMTDAERTAFKEKMDAERTAMQAEHESAIEEVYSDLVDAGTLTQEQADVLQDLMKDHKLGGRGHGGMERFGAPSAAPAKAAE